MSPERHELVVLSDGAVIVPDLPDGLMGLVRHLDGSRLEAVAGLLGEPRLSRARAIQLPLHEPPAAMRTDLLWRWHARGAAAYRGAREQNRSYRETAQALATAVAQLSPPCKEGIKGWSYPGASHRSDLTCPRSRDALDEPTTPNPSFQGGESRSTSWLAVKQELARRLLGPVCRLCARRCRVDRRAGEVGFCGLGPGLRLAATMRLWGEEPELGRPGLALPAIGCGLRCRFCYRAEHLDPGAGAATDPDDVAFAIDAADDVAHVHWLGGSPDENLPAILDVLCRVCLPRPVVWNTHSYLTAEQVSLLEGVVDGFVADLKFGPGPCAERIAGVTGYWAAATAALRRMVGSGALVIVRHVALPGHLDCCAEPVRRWLADELPAARVRVLTHYEPFSAARGDGLLGRRLNDTERRRLERWERER